MPRPKPKGKRVTRAAEIVPSIPWWKSPQILVSIGGIAGGVVAFCHAFHIPMPFSQIELSEGIAACLSIGASAYFLYRRVKTGLDPENPNPRLTR